MRRLLLGVVVGCGVGFVAASASAGSFAPPPQAKAWLGIWRTSQGEFRFDRLSACVSAPNLVAPNCRLDGSWRQPGGDSHPITGHVFLGPRYKGEVWQGCYALPDQPSGTQCNFDTGGDISLDRSDARFTDGYWKACGLGALCADHHPIRGSRVGGCIPAPDRRQAHAACGGDAWPFTYEMLPEYGKTGDDGIIELPTTEAEVNPSWFGVRLKLAHGGRCKSAWTFRAEVDGHGFDQTATDRRDCELHVTVPRVGDYKVELTGTVDGREVAQQQTIRVVNWLIVGLGDSLASGEGNPDFPRGGGRLTGRWEDSACHRSHYSWQSQIARRLESHDEETSVTFVSLSCSGAGIASGLLGPYNGLHDTAPITPQLDEARDLIGDRQVDAVMISAGINDLGFGSIVNFCATTRNCVEQTFKDGMTVRQYAAAKLAQLPGLYAQLRHRLGELAPPGRIFITVYPDELHAPDGSFCDAVASNPLGSIDGSEAQFLYQEMQLRLNGELEAAFGHGGYHLLRRAQHMFDDHGYCAPEGDRWVVTLDDSDALQGDNFGTLHPNHAGHFEIGKFAWSEVYPDLYRDGVARMPGAS